ncbi:MAG TPA: PQQ-binding-like beta-propeller repeat protein [Gaiellaceae bacterium]|nr:PQQ-binding-like beta-propeller repeat protein [Gaiellaceae bacterium]
MYRKPALLLALALVPAGAVAAALVHSPGASRAWPVANGDPTSRRAADGGRLSAATASRLRVRWRFRLPRAATSFGAITASPVIDGGTVYVQDSSSSVYALDARTGALRWRHHYVAPNDGPNGVAVAGSRLFTATDTTALALDARTGRTLWSRRLVGRREQFVAIAPVVDRGRVYYSTQGFPPGGRGALYALDARTGRVVWRFDTIAQPWPRPEAGGGGAWYPVSVDEHGDVYAGNSNPAPWGGSPARPNGADFAGPALYTDSLLVLSGRTGRLLWYDQVTRHDVRDYDFQASPVLASVGGRRVVFGAGKAGRVVAWDRSTHARIWSRAVGTHLHDLGPLPRRTTTVCPGHLGGVETPMAYADGRLFVPVVELCSRESAVTSPSAFTRPPAEGRGVLYALDAQTGRTIWRRALAAPPFGCATAARDAVVVPTYDGRLTVYDARDGRVVWRARLPDGNNSCPAVGGDLLVVGAGAPYPGLAHPVAEVVAYGLPG